MARPGVLHHCHWETCARRCFNTSADLKRHLDELHKGRQPRYACPVVDCAHHSDRRIEMGPHIKGKHGGIALSLAKANMAQSGKMSYGVIRIKAGWEMLARKNRDAWEVLDDGTSQQVTTSGIQPSYTPASEDETHESSGPDEAEMSSGPSEEDQPGPSGTLIKV